MGEIDGVYDKFLLPKNYFILPNLYSIFIVENL